MTILNWMNYKLFNYERLLGLTEVEHLIGVQSISTHNPIEISHEIPPSLLEELTYFDSYVLNNTKRETNQKIIESSLNNSKNNRQNTRYGVHGLHEYKGKFNPQVVRSLLNIFGIKPGQTVLDPFCGSGTTLVEASTMGINSIGIDMNPLACEIAKTKILLLSSNINQLEQEVTSFLSSIDNKQAKKCDLIDDTRTAYLLKWFPKDILCELEYIKNKTTNLSPTVKSFLLIVISNLLREYSLQEPSDLRIRRRKSPLPVKPITTAIIENSFFQLSRIKKFKSIIKKSNSKSFTLNEDIRTPSQASILKTMTFDFAITSPPYATALPYIDTQRLSLVWLGLIGSDEIKKYDSELIGSREFKTKDKDKILSDMYQNTGKINQDLQQVCLSLQDRLSENDGFRRQAVPMLLYRYFSDMKAMFDNVKSIMKKNSFFALIVGHNFTRLGGQKIDINTPSYLANQAKSCGWRIEDIVNLDTYHRYGIHAANSISKESLIILQNNDRISSPSSGLFNRISKRLN